MVLGADGEPLGKMRSDGMVVARDGRILGKRHPHGSVVAPGPMDVLVTNTYVRPPSPSKLSGRLSPPASRSLPEGWTDPFSPDAFSA